MSSSPPRDPESALGRLAHSRVAGALVLALGGALRLWAVQHARFDSDEALFWTAALHIVRGDAFPVHGAVMSGGDAAVPGALFYYVMALPQLLSADPRAGSLFTAALNMLAVWLVFRALRDSGQPEAAASWLIVGAFSPWIVVYGDRIWTANLLIPFGAAAVFALERTLRHEQSRFAALLGFLLVVGLQIHPSYIHMWTVALAALLVFRPRLNARWLAAGLLTGALTYAPYLVQDWASGFANTRLLLAGTGRPAHGVGTLLGLLLQYLGFATTDVSFLIARGFYGGFDTVPFWSQGGIGRTRLYYAEAGAAPLLWAVQMMGWILVLAGLVLVGRSWRPADRRLWDVLFASGALSLGLLNLLSGRGGFAHYVVVLAPLSAWPLMLALRALARGRWWWVSAVYLTAVVPAGWLLLRPYYQIDSRQSVAQLNRVIGFVLARTADRRPFELHVELDEGRPSTYGVLAREYHRAVWRASPHAVDVFTVVPTGQAAPARPPGRVAATATLGALTVIHSLR